MATVDTLPTISPDSSDYLIVEKVGGGTSKATITDVALQGPAGPAGPAGEAGPPGESGADGSPGHTPVLLSGTEVTGTQDPITAAVYGAVLGDIYLNTETGNLYGYLGATSWHYAGCIKGPQGPAGSSADVPLAGTDVAGKVKVDGTTITVTADGTISAKAVAPDLSDYVTKADLEKALENYLERG